MIGTRRGSQSRNLEPKFLLLCRRPSILLFYNAYAQFVRMQMYVDDKKAEDTSDLTPICYSIGVEDVLMQGFQRIWTAVALLVFQV